MRGRFLRAVALGLCLALPQALLAQDSADLATLVADRVDLRGDLLVASGSVEVFAGTDRLRATRVTYNAQTGALEIEGPLVLTTDDGQSTIYADAANLSDSLREGILRSARLVLEDSLQIAATEIERIDGRYTRLNNTVASTCQVCAERPVPLWQIRAAEVIHDAQAQQVYFRDARFEVAGVPVLWLPQLRFPGPGLERSTGFLSPSIRSTNALGVGIKIPYFITLGDHADLTLTPYLSAASTRTLEARYRHAFASGGIEVNAAFTRDDIRSGDTRSYLFAEGAFALKRGYRLTFDVEAVSDRGYLLDYAYSEKDRLDSAIEVARYGQDGFTFAGLTAYRTLREGESNDTQPTILLDAGIERRFQPAVLGGTATARLMTHGHYRRSDLDIDSPDADSVVDGRDIFRIEAALDWRRDWILGPGLLLEAETAVSVSHTRIAQDAAFPSSVNQSWGAAAMTLRWPLMRRMQTGGSFLLEPIAQLVWSDDSSETLPRDESTLLEFDEANLTALDRFPGGDVFEAGARANLGLRMAHQTGAGYRWDLTLARIWREQDLGQFAGTPALAGDSSHWLASLSLDMPGKLNLRNRALFDESYRFASNSLRMDWQQEDLSLAGTYLWLRANPAEDLPDDISELSLDAEYRIDENWAASLDYRFDFQQNRAASAELGLAYTNDCIVVDLSLSRRFTSSTTVLPTTDLGVEVRLMGFGKGGSGGRPTGACTG